MRLKLGMQYNARQLQCMKCDLKLLQIGIVGNTPYLLNLRLQALHLLLQCQCALGQLIVCCTSSCVVLLQRPQPPFQSCHTCTTTDMNEV